MAQKSNPQDDDYSEEAHQNDSIAHRGWTLNKLVALLITATYFMLVADLRYEHVDKVRRHWTAWIPIDYSAIMTVIGIVGLVLWARRGREMLFYAFSTSIIVGLLGFWLHNHGHLIGGIETTLGAWIRFEKHADRPPILAPLAFCGLGVLGILACYKGDPKAMM